MASEQSAVKWKSDGLLMNSLPSQWVAANVVGATYAALSTSTDAYVAACPAAVATDLTSLIKPPLFTASERSELTDEKASAGESAPAWVVGGGGW